MKFGNCVCVWEARDDEEETVVFRLRFPIAAFYSLLVISFSQHQLVKTEEPDMKHKKNLKDETPGDSHISDLKPYKVNVCKYWFCYVRFCFRPHLYLVVEFISSFLCKIKPHINRLF